MFAGEDCAAVSLFVPSEPAAQKQSVHEPPATVALPALPCSSSACPTANLWDWWAKQRHLLPEPQQQLRFPLPAASCATPGADVQWRRWRETFVIGPWPPLGQRIQLVQKLNVFLFTFEERQTAVTMRSQLSSQTWMKWILCARCWHKLWPGVSSQNEALWQGCSASEALPRPRPVLCLSWLLSRSWGRELKQ